MDLEIDPQFTFTAAQRMLIERARNALKHFDLRDAKKPENVSIVVATVWPAPSFRLDFMVKHPGVVGQAFLGTAEGVPLEERVFEKDHLNAALIMQLEGWFKEYLDYADTPA